MPSIRVKKGYQTLDAPQPPDPLQPDLQPPPATLPRSNSWQAATADGSLQLPPQERPPVRRPRAGSRVSTHIMLNARPSPRPSFIRTPEPSQAHAQEDRLFHAPAQGRRRTYTVEGQQADIRVPDEHERGIEGSQVNLALEEMQDGYPAHDRMDTHHHDDIVEHLDVIDPQISTVSMLTNAANAIVVPPLSFYSRKPVVVLPTISRKEKPQDTERGHVSSIDEHSDEDALDRHVEDVLRKRDKFRRIMKGVWAFVKTPLGFITAVYGFLVVFWGTGIVLFLAKMINLHNDIQQGYWVELCQQVETGLFTATSIGFIPFRVMDSYRAYKIWHYKRIVAKRRAKAGLPELFDPDDLPDPVYDPNYVQVLTEKEQIDLHYQQHQFMLSQTWYRPHGTQTHRAFPISLAVWIIVCNDLNSFFQILLSGCMWGLDRFARPAWTTATTLPAAFVAGIAAGVLIYYGGKNTRRTEVVEDRLRAALEMEHAHGRERDEEKNGLVNGSSSADGDGPAADPSTPRIYVEAPDGLPAAQPPPSGLPESATTTEESTNGDDDDEKAALRREPPKGKCRDVLPDADGVVRKDTLPVPRTVSTQTVGGLEEMTVPHVEDLPPHPPSA